MSTMPLNSSSDFKSQVLAVTDIVQLISQSVALKRVGKDYKGLCPFHQEKTPSFKVDPGKQLFYCFGCKASGTAFDFVMKRDRVEFRDALRILAERAGLEVPQWNKGSQKPDERKPLLEAISAACQFFENRLADAQAGAAARAYLEKRGITPQTTKTFRLGLAMDAWDAFVKSPTARKLDKRILVAAGLIKERSDGAFDQDAGHYDTFRNRLIFPIRNESGQVIAFGGRAMPGSDDPAKYLNTPETPLFSKRRCVFGLDLARQKIVETRTAVVVEGYTDVVVAHQCGVSNVVSVLGTAMTEQHLGILKRFADRIVLLFDADVAGDNAVDKAVELFLTQPIEMAIASLPKGVDPDEFLLANGVAAFEQIVAQAPDVLAYKWKQLERRYKSEADDVTGQQKAVEQYLELLASARGAGPIDPIRWGQALVRVNRLTAIPMDELNRRFRPRRASAGRRPANRGGHSDLQQAQVEDPSTPTNQTPTSRLTWAQEQAERKILGILLAHPSFWQRVQVEMQAADFACPELRPLAQLYWNHQHDEGEVVLNEFLGLLSEKSVPAPAVDPVAATVVVTPEPIAPAGPVNLTSVAMELIAEVEELAEVDSMLTHCLGYLAMQRAKIEQDKQVAQLGRMSQEKQIADSAASPDKAARDVSEEAELAMFAKFVKNLQPTNLHRLGPVRQAGS